MTNISCEELLNKLSSESRIEHRQGIENFIAHRQTKEDPIPIYLRVVLGIGAFLSSVFILGFLGLADFISFRGGDSIPWGIAFTIAAIFIYRKSQDQSQTSAGDSFLTQLSFCFIGVGKTLFVFGFVSVFRSDSPLTITIATLIVTASTYHLYNLFLDRIASSFSVFFSFNLWVWFQGRDEFTFVTIFVAQLVLAAYIFTSATLRTVYRPIGYALAMSLASFIMVAMVDDHTSRLVIHWGMSAALVIAAIFLVYRIMDGKQNDVFYLAAITFVVFGSIAASGVLFIILLMVLGYSQHDRLLLWSGYLLLPGYLCMYYYNLNLDLLTKSFILIASGIVLLAGNWFIKYRGYVEELQ